MQAFPSRWKVFFLILLCLGGTACRRRKPSPQKPAGLVFTMDEFGCKVFEEHLRLAKPGAPPRQITAVQFSPHGRYLISLDSEGGMAVRDFKTDQLSMWLMGGATGLAISPMGKLLAVVMKESVTVYALPELTVITTLRPPMGDSLESAAFDSSNRLYASGWGHGWYEWDLDKGGAMRTLDIPEWGHMTELRFNRDERYLTARGASAAWGWDRQALAFTFHAPNVMGSNSFRLRRIGSNWAILKGVQYGISVAFETDPDPESPMVPGSGPLFRSSGLRLDSNLSHKDVLFPQLMEATPDASILVVGERGGTWNAWHWAEPDKPHAFRTAAAYQCLCIDEVNERMAMGLPDGKVVVVPLF